MDEEMSVFPKVDVFPEPSMFDKPLHVLARGLPPNEILTFYLTTAITNDCIYESYASYQTSRQGVVDFTKDEALSGSYIGIQPMGLFWSVTHFSETRRKVARFIKTDVTRPQSYLLQVFEEKNSLEECRNTSKSKSITSTIINRWLLAPGVRRIPIRENGLVGTLFLPPGNGPFPGLIYLFGGYPGVLEYKSALHASHGFASLALAYFGVEGLPDTLFKQLDLEYFERAVNYMLENDNIQSDNGIGLVSNCYGAQIAIAMSTLFKGIRCVVAVNGSSFVTWGAMYKERVWGNMFKDFDFSNFKPNQDNNSGNLLLHLCPKNFETHPDHFPFHKQRNVSYMIVCGLEDKIYLPFIVKEMERLFNKENHPDFEVLKYNGTGHLIEPPYFGFTNSCFQIGGSMNTYLACGGELTMHCKSQIDFWPKMFKFLDERLNIISSSNLVAKL